MPEDGATLSLHRLDVETVVGLDDPAWAVGVVHLGAEPRFLRSVDSVLDLHLEALAANGTWQRIQGRPRSTCGNSYYRVALAPEAAWIARIPVHDGPVETLLRVRLDDAVSASWPGRIPDWPPGDDATTPE